MKLRLLGFIFISLTLTCSQIERLSAQNRYDQNYVSSVADSVRRYIESHPRKFKPKENRLKITPLLGVTYSPENNLGFYTGVFGSYKNSVYKGAKLSSFTLYTDFSINRSFSGKISGEHYSRSDRFCIDYTLAYFHYFRKFWGVGYDNNIQDVNISKYIQNGVRFNTRFIFLPTSWLNIAPAIGYHYNYSYDFSKPSLIEGYRLKTNSIKVGLRGDFDTRSEKINPEKGIYALIEQTLFLWKGEFPYHRTTIIADAFFSFWKGGVFAIDLFGEFNYGATPWIEYSMLGGENRMRGYYFGRFRDRNMTSFQVELRQHLYKNHSMVIWGGVGNIFPSFKMFNIKQTLPTYGAGYRFLLDKQLLRLDIGFGKSGQWSLTVGLNHAF